MIRRDKIIRQALRERFVVTLKGGESFEGILIEADDKSLRLVDSFAVSGKNRVSVDGDLYLPRPEVSYLQRPGGLA